MMTRTLSAIAALAFCFIGCTTDDDGLANQERGGIGKADIVGSCVDTSCDGQAPEGNCYCDDKCEDFGDCCTDYAPACNRIFCGGFAALPCPEGMICVDYPLDTCDPEANGADCGGMCVEDEKRCGGMQGLGCGEGEYCHYDLEAQCGAADDLGVCKVAPQFCAELYAPVCGCDGQTYSNECFANSAGASAASRGACESTPPDPALDSCEGRCGSSAVECSCDEECAANGDCCADYEEYCPEREIASGMCVKNSLDSCETDDDCIAGGCGGALCYNPANGGGISTCECTAPTGPTGCGCVAGQCAWYN